MNLDELQSVQARERQSSDLQHLRSSFYREVGEYIQALSEERDELVERVDDPFSSSEVRQLTDDIETAEQTVEAIYERRVGKVVKKASIAAAGMPVDDDGLTEEEETLFEDLVARIERNRDTVLAVLDGETPDLSGSVETGMDAASEVTDPGPAPTGGDTDPATDRAPESTTDPEPSRDRGESNPDDGVSAADLMGSGPEAGTGDDGGPGEGSPADVPEDDPLAADPDGAPTEVPPEPGPPGEAGSADASVGDEPAGATAEDDASSDDRHDPTSGERDVPGIPRTTVRITADVGEVVGADDRDYDLGPEDVVTLPEPNADVLVEKDAAERLE